MVRHPPWETRTHPETTVTCYTQPSTVAAPVDETIATLRAYDRRDAIADLTVETWPAEVPVADEDDEPAAIADYRWFRTWAERADVSMQPAFGFRERTTLVSDTAETVLRLPKCCLAVSVDGSLELVAPHRRAETTVTVGDCLSLLDGRTTDDAGSGDRPPSPTPTPDRCPACGETLVSGQGLYACASCSWRGTSEATTEGDAAGAGEGDTDDRAPPAEAPEPRH